MPTMAVVFDDDNIAMVVYSMSTSPELVNLMGVCKKGYESVHKSTPKLLKSVYDMPFPTPSRFHATSAVHLMFLCEATSRLYQHLLTQQDNDTHVRSANPNFYDGQLTSTDFSGAVCFSAPKQNATQVCDRHKFARCSRKRERKGMPRRKAVCLVKCTF